MCGMLALPIVLAIKVLITELCHCNVMGFLDTKLQSD